MQQMLKRFICYLLFFGQIFPPQVFATQTISIQDVRQCDLEIESVNHRLKVVYLNQPEILKLYEIALDQSLTQLREPLFFLDKTTGTHLGTLQINGDGASLSWADTNLSVELFADCPHDLVVEAEADVTLKSAQLLTYKVSLSALNANLRDLSCKGITAHAKQKLSAGGRFSASAAALFGDAVDLAADLRFQGTCLQATGQTLTTHDGLQVLSHQLVRFHAANLKPIYGKYTINKSADVADATDVEDATGPKDIGFFAKGNGNVLFAASASLTLEHGLARLSGLNTYVYGKLQQTTEETPLTLQALAKSLTVIKSKHLLANLVVRGKAQELQVIRFSCDRINICSARTITPSKPNANQRFSC